MGSFVIREVQIVSNSNQGKPIANKHYQFVYQFSSIATCTACTGISAWFQQATDRNSTVGDYALVKFQLATYMLSDNTQGTTAILEQ